jgi:hypothetical protein
MQKEVIFVYCENHTKRINKLRGQSAEFTQCLSMWFTLLSDVSWVYIPGWHSFAGGRYYGIMNMDGQ